MSNKDEKGETNAITVSSVTSISMNPPSLLICINKSSRIHDTLQVGSQFCVNLLNKHQTEHWNINKVPYLSNAQANIFCKVDKLTSYHTHTIVIGLVEDAKYADEISTLTYVDGEYK